MMRLLFWLALIVLVWFAIRSRIKSNLRKMEAQQNLPRTQDPGREGEQMLMCAHCKIYFPASEAVHDAASGLAFCSEAHRQQHCAT